MENEQYRQMDKTDLSILEAKAYENVKQIVIVGITSLIGIAVYEFFSLTISIL
jgi:hypothetical protein